MTSSFALGALAFKALYAIVRTESLGVQNVSRHRSYWEPWRRKLFTPSFALGALAFEALDAIVCTESLAVQDVSRHRSYGGGDLGVKAVSVTRPSVGLKAHANVRTGSLGVKSSSHCSKPLGTSVANARYVTARSWEPWCSEMFTLPLALGSLGVEVY